MYICIDVHILLGETIDIEANVQEPVIDYNQEVDKSIYLYIYTSRYKYTCINFVR
jgi:hypothetical protein